MSEKYQEYLNKIDLGLISKPRNWRMGQFHFNFLMDNHPQIAEKIRGTKEDPFYLDDRIEIFLESVKKHLGD